MLTPRLLGRSGNPDTSEEPNSQMLRGCGSTNNDTLHPDIIHFRRPISLQCCGPRLDEAVNEPEAEVSQSKNFILAPVPGCTGMSHNSQSAESGKPSLIQINLDKVISRLYVTDITFDEVERNRVKRIARRSEELDYAMGYTVAEPVSSKHLSICYPVLWTVGTPCFGVAIALAGFGFFPLKDVIDEPRSWWRCMVVCAFTSFAPLCLVISQIPSILVLSEYFFFPIKMWLSTCLVSTCTWLLLWSLITWLWVDAIGKKLPVPFLQLVWPLSICVVLPIMWLWIPRALRVDPRLRKRFLYASLAFPLLGALFVTYYLVFVLVVNVPATWQWVTSPVVIVNREIFQWVSMRIANSAGILDDSSIPVVIASLITTFHAYFLSAIVGSAATLETTIAFISLDTANNVYLGIKVRQQWSKDEEREECKINCQTVVEIEVLEVVLPCAYLLFIVVAFYSPNARVLGNIRLSLFHFVEISDISASIWNMLLLILVDAISLVFLGLHLWWKCRVNIWQVYLHIRRHFSLVTGSIQLIIIAGFPCLLVVACGVDLSFQFEWLQT